jgi:polar amino acid transport system permease protein
MFGEIIMPQALRIALPLMGNTSIGLLKDTSLATFIGTNDLMNSARDVAINTYRPIEVFTLAAIVYFALTYPLSLFTTFLERRGAWTRTVAL